MAKFNAENAMKVVKKGERTIPSEPIDKGKLYRDYYSLETGEPIPLEQISNRIRKRFNDIEKASVGAMLDLFFVYQQWTGFYSRTDSFGKYLKDDIQISRTHGYGIINSVELLYEYYIHKGLQADDLENFMGEVSSSLESIGVKKLGIISALKNDDQKYDFLERLIGGETLSANDLKVKSAPKEKQNIPVTLKDNDILIGDKVALTFQSTNKQLRKKVLTAVKKHYLDMWSKEIK
jgi:hypothetical protein